MRELTICEMQSVSGGDFFEFVGSVIIGGITGTTSYAMKWAMSGGSTGGIIGAGIISGGVGLIIGSVVGLINGVLYGAINGWDVTVAWFNTLVENTLDPNAPVITA